MNPYIIKKPVITEKSLGQANSNNCYTFQVDVAATKHQIKQAIEELFSVHVEQVRTITDKPSDKRTGKRRTQTAQAKTKKAVVTLKAGETIELFEVGGGVTE